MAGRVKVRVRLAGKADDNIRREGRLVEGLTDAAAALQEACPAVAAFHAGGGGVAAALQAEMQVRDDARQVAEGADQVVTCLGGFEAAQADAELSRQLAE